MRFLIHSTVDADAQGAMKKHEQTCHTLEELAAEPEAAGDLESLKSDPKRLLSLLEKKQWNLLTTDTAFVRDLYEKKVEFAGSVVQILEDAAAENEQGSAIDRLFERYKRLTPRRLYTVTASRVKIRQLPGGHLHS